MCIEGYWLNLHVNTYKTSCKLASKKTFIGIKVVEEILSKINSVHILKQEPTFLFFNNTQKYQSNLEQHGCLRY